MAMIAGSTITLGDKRYTVPALTLRQFTRHRATLSSLSAATDRELTDDELQKVVALVHECLARNYADLTIDAVWDGLDLRSMPQAIRAIAGASELEEVGNA